MNQGNRILLIFLPLLIILLFNRDVLAFAQGVGADFSWPGPGSGTVTATLENNETTYAKNAAITVEFGAYWCDEGGTSACAPDLAGIDKADQTLTFRHETLILPGKNRKTLSLFVPSLAGKTCGRFQVDFGFPSGGGIIGGRTFQIGANCPGPAPAPAAAPPICPYGSTQARMQRNLSDPWDTFKTITLGEQIRVGGFHNGTGLLAGDVVIQVLGPSFSATPPNGGFITPPNVGSFSVIVTTIGGSGSACTDTAGFQVNPGPTPSPTPSPTPIVIVIQQQQQQQQQQAPVVLAAQAPRELPRAGAPDIFVPGLAGIGGVGWWLRRKFKLV